MYSFADLHINACTTTIWLTAVGRLRNIDLALPRIFAILLRRFFTREPRSASVSTSAYVVLVGESLLKIGPTARG